MCLVEVPAKDAIDDPLRGEGSQKDGEQTRRQSGNQALQLAREPECARMARAERAVSAALGCLRSQGRSKVTMAPEAVPTRFERDTDQAAAENCCARVARTCESL